MPKFRKDPKIIMLNRGSKRIQMLYGICKDEEYYDIHLYNEAWDSIVPMAELMTDDPEELEEKRMDQNKRSKYLIHLIHVRIFAFVRYD